MNLTYILKDRVAVAEPNIGKWLDWMVANPNNSVASTEVPGGRVSTVFLGVGYKGKTFETAFLGREGVDIVNRYQTWEEAVAGHLEAVKARMHDEGTPGKQ
jgi:hypothetical protein